MMNKKLSLIVAFAMAISLTTPTLAASANTATEVTTKQSSIVDNTNISGNLTLEDALNNIEKRNTSIQLMNQKMLLLNRQYDYDHQNAIDYSDTIDYVNKNSNQYIALKEQILIKPQQSAKAVDDAKHAREDALKSLKFNMKRQYMNVLNCQDQIKNINASIENIDKQIKKVNANINLGMTTTASLQQLNVQRSQLVAALNTPKSFMEQSVLTVKQILNLDLNTELVLSPAKADFVKFDDSNIQARINKAVENNYDLAGINRNIEWGKTRVELNTKYGHNNTTGLVNAELSLQNAINSLDNTKLNLQIGLWSSYYNLKNKEDSTVAEKVNLENAKENYNNAVAKFQVGQVDQLEVDSKKLALEKEELTMQSLVNDYMVTVDEFKDKLEE